MDHLSLMVNTKCESQEVGNFVGLEPLEQQKV